MKRLVLFFALLIALFSMNFASAATNISGCSNITVAGNYVLITSITNWAGLTACINISVSDVEIDCVGWNNWIDGVDTNNTYGIWSGGISSAKLTNITIKNCNLSDWLIAINANLTENSTFDNLILRNNSDKGIFLGSSAYNNLTNINSSNNKYGFFFNSNSNYNNLVNSSITENTFGLLVKGSSYNNFSNLDVSNNSNGILLNNSNSFWPINYNTISNSIIKDNKQYGMDLVFAQYNNITGCRIENNSASGYAGIYIYSEGYCDDGANSSYNRFWNNIFNNTLNGGLNWKIHGDWNCTNYFNTTKTSGTNIIGGPNIGGNWWSDYTGKDTDGDGIGSDYYIISPPGWGYMIDYLPLTNNMDYNLSRCGKITSSGRYVLNQSITDSSNISCINISVSDLEIDCTGWNNWIDGKGLSGTIGIKVASDNGSKLSNVSIKNCNITNWETGVYYNGVENSTLQDINSFNNNVYGVLIDQNSNYLNLTDISASFNGNGVYIGSSSNHLMSINSSYNYYGIYLKNSSNNTVRNIIVSNNSNSGIALFGSSDNTIKNINASKNLNSMPGLPNQICNGGGIFIGDYSPTEEDNNNIFANMNISNNIFGICTIWGAMSFVNNTFVNITASYNSLDGIGYRTGPGSRFNNNTFLNIIAVNNGRNGISLSLGSYDQLPLYTSGNRIINSTLQENGGKDFNFFANNYRLMEYYIPDSACETNLTNVTGSGGRPIKLYNASVHLQDTVYSELILCEADNSVLDNITIEGSASKKNNQLKILRTNNAIFSNINSSFNSEGINLSSSSNNTFINVTASYNSMNGISSYYSSENNLYNTVTSDNFQVGIYLYGGSYNNCFNTSSYNNLIYGVHFDYATNSKLRGITLSNNTAGGVAISGGGNNTIENVIYLNSTSYDINLTSASLNLKDSPVGPYKFQEVNLSFENSSAGMISLSNITQNGTDLSQDMILRNNYTSINSSNAEGLNRSAYITFLNLSLTSPRIMRNGYPCPSSICTLNSWNQSNGTLLFSVTGFSSYTAEENPVDYNLSRCGKITSSGRYVLNQSITNSSLYISCINISVSDVEIDCVGWNLGISGQSASWTIGIRIEPNHPYVDKLGNITIKNCNLSNWDYGIHSLYMQNSSFSNIIVYNNTQSGIYFDTSSHNRLSGISFITNGQGSYSTSGSNNSITNTTNTNNPGYDLNTTDTSITTETNIGSYTFSNVTLTVENSSYVSVSLPNITQNGTNFSDVVIVRNNYVFINSSNAPGLNRSANITFYGLSFSNPRIIRDGVLCPAAICTLISYNSGTGTLVFSVTGFSNYSAEETTSGSQPPSGSSGGGGGGTASLTYTIGDLKETQEINRELGKGDRINFNLINLGHNLTLKKITRDNATIEINSSSLLITLLVGESRKLNLSSADFYNLLVRLNEINNLKANITIMAINEAIAKPLEEKKPAENITENKPQEIKTETTKEKPKSFVLLPYLVGLIVIIIGFITFKYYKKK